VLANLKQIEGKGQGRCLERGFSSTSGPQSVDPGARRGVERERRPGKFEDRPSLVAWWKAGSAFRLTDVNNNPPVLTLSTLMWDACWFPVCGAAVL
jgi:hypothetical protein